MDTVSIVPLTPSEIVSILSVGVAIVASVIGPWISLTIATRQINAPIRQRWTEELLELLSRLLSECRKNVILLEGDGLLNQNICAPLDLQQLLFFEQKISLMLDPKEKRQATLLQLIESISDDVQHGCKNLIEFGEKLNSAATICRQIVGPLRIGQ